MDFNNIFRSFFGFRDPPSDNNVGDNEDMEEFPEGGFHFGFFGPSFNFPSGRPVNGDDDDDTSDEGMRGAFGWGSHSDGFFDFERESQEMFRHFEEMFRTFGLSDFHSLNIPSIETTPNRRSISPRDEMLKQPDELKEKVKGHSDESTRGSQQNESTHTNKDNPVRFGDVFKSPWHWNIPALPSATEREDKDLDDHVNNGRLDELLKPKQQQPHTRSFSKSVSIQTIRKPDGTIEQRCTERDSDGNVKTSVTTSQDDQNPVFTRPSIPSWRWPNFQPAEEGDPQRQSLFDKFFGSWNR